MKSIGLLSLFALIVLVSGHPYPHPVRIQVELGGGNFEPVNGTLKLKIYRGWFSSGTYTLNEGLLETEKTFTTETNLPSIGNVHQAKFYWTLSSQSKYLSGEPSIWLKRVKIIPDYIKDPQERESMTKYLCPYTAPLSFPAKLKQNEKVLLLHC